MKKKMYKRVVALLCASVMVLSLTACQKTESTDTAADNQQAAETKEETGNSEPQTEETSAGDKKVYGYITPGPDTWYQRNVEGFQMGAEKAGYDVVVLNSDYDASKEVANIDAMINQGVDGVCIFSFNENGAKIAAEKFAEAGIPVVATDSCATALDAEQDIVAAIDFDWVEMGNNYAQWMADNHAGENYVIITGNFESVPCQMINEAMTAKSEELAQNECIDIREGKYDPSEAVNVAQDLISSGKEFSIIYVMNEDMAAAVVQMLENNNLLDQYTVIAQNGSPAGLPLIENGKLSYTISSSPGWEGLVSFLVLDQYVTGSSTAVEQAVMLPIMPVDQENINDESKVVPWEVNDIYWDLTNEYFPDLMK
ncbi:sugar ABC transporter substrate-binding protein [Kineothrix sedimenti]|uniref:Sugar ABC transporter substrate-binding protein n=1 Tax=Kineothrix sedimenti TaxID=3123317 RepID=A0ABZ3EUG3_9FIRM